VDVAIENDVQEYSNTETDLSQKVEWGTPDFYVASHLHQQPKSRIGIVHPLTSA
jgi:hypothetical protein